MKQDRLYYLMGRYEEKVLSAEESAELAALLRDPDVIAGMDDERNPWLLQVFPAVDVSGPDPDLEQQIRTILSVDRPAEHTVVVHPVHFVRTAWVRYAAVLLLIAGTATFLYLNNRPQKAIAIKESLQPPTILPGGNKAILTLSDGSTIVLDSAANGALAEQGGAQIRKLDVGKLAYQSGTVSGTIGMNTIRTPKGGQYQITLPDGTNVWLNAASSITFPTAFGKDRQVRVTGEVYLEVAADKSKPFTAHVNDVDVEVLGTSYNIHAYADEAQMQTTLVQGAVRVRRGKGNLLLKPGQQAQTTVSLGAVKLVPDANVQQVLAWKNGWFNFNGLGVQELMRQVARWYDVEVVYPGTIPTEEFVGEIERSSTLQDVLGRLERIGIKTRIEGGRTVIVLPPE